MLARGSDLDTYDRSIMRAVTIAAMFLAAALPLFAEDAPLHAEDVYKNIQVLRGLPASELQDTMFFMKGALGVNCNHCHVNFRDFEKDDNPKKAIARRMIQMVRSLNESQFSGQPMINCNTCHRGQTQPAAPLAFAPIRESPPVTKTADAPPPASLPTVEQIFDRYENATGGRAAHARIKTRSLTGVQLSTEGATRPFRLLQQLPDRFVRILTVDSDWYEVFDGSKGWSRDNHGTHELTGKRLAQLKRDNALFDPAALRAQYTDLAVTGVEGSDFVLEGTRGAFGNERLHFARESGLLVRITSVAKTAFGPLPDEIRLEDYREVDGIRLPMLVSFLKPDFSSSYKFTEVKHGVPFTPPPASEEPPPAAHPPGS